MLEQGGTPKHRLPSPTMRAVPVHVPLLVTLSDLAAGAIGELQDDAGTIIIGEVVQFARELNSLIQQPYLRAYA